MRNPSDLEVGDKTTATNSNQVSIVYGYPIHPPATSRYLLWTRTSSSSSSILSEVATGPHVNPRSKRLLYISLFTVAIGFWGLLVLHGIGEVMNSQNYPKFEVESISFYPPSNVTRGPNWTIGVNVRNTNRHTRMAFEDFKVSIYYKADKLSMATVSTLYLGPKNETLIMVMLEGGSVKEKNVIGNEIAEDGRRRSVKFDVVLQVNMTYLFQFPSIKGKKITKNTELLCSDMEVRFSSNVTGRGVVVGGPYQCDSHLVIRHGL